MKIGQKVETRRGDWGVVKEIKKLPIEGTWVVLQTDGVVKHMPIRNLKFS